MDLDGDLDGDDIKLEVRDEKGTTNVTFIELTEGQTMLNICNSFLFL